ncbi:MAG: hypothetical protein ACI3YQ_05295 [Prevotella sp.]
MNSLIKKFISFAFAVAFSCNASAQTVSTGYYRVESVLLNQCLYFKSKVAQDVDYTTAGVDLPNIRGSLDKTAVYHMPETVLYLEYISTERDGAIRVDLASQGVTASSIAGNAKLRIKKEVSKNAYYAFAEAKGAIKYLVARQNLDDDWNEQDCDVQTDEKSSDNKPLWKLRKLDESSEYFGISPRVEFNGEYYDPFYVFFPYSFSSSGLKAYCITSTPTTADGKAYAVYKEVTGTVPVGTPLIVKCSSKDPINNKLKINGVTPQSLPFTNCMRGAYRSCDDPEVPGIKDVVNYDSKTMRILGITSEGKLGFVTATYSYFPKNTAYLVVPSAYPKELTLISQEEYNDLIAGIDDVMVDGQQNVPARVKGVYNLSGVKVCETSEFNSLPSGVYIVDGQQKVK